MCLLNDQLNDLSITQSSKINFEEKKSSFVHILKNVATRNT